MKAIDIIKALLTNCYNMEQMGLYTYNGVKDAKRFFGDGAFGSITCAILFGDTFLYCYKHTDEDPMIDGKEPDAWFHTKDGSVIALFKIYDA